MPCLATLERAGPGIARIGGLGHGSAAAHPPASLAGMCWRWEPGALELASLSPCSAPCLRLRPSGPAAFGGLSAEQACSSPLPPSWTVQTPKRFPALLFHSSVYFMPRAKPSAAHATVRRSGPLASGRHPAQASRAGRQPRRRKPAKAASLACQTPADGQTVASRRQTATTRCQRQIGGRAFQRLPIATENLPMRRKGPADKKV